MKGDRGEARTNPEEAPIFKERVGFFSFAGFVGSSLQSL